MRVLRTIRSGLRPAAMATLLGASAAVLAVGATVSSATPAAAAPARGRGSTGISPRVGCPPSTPWFVKASVATQAWGTGPARWFYNYNATAASETLTTGTVSTVQYSIQASQSVEAGIIFASASLSFTEGLSYSHSDDLTVSYALQDIPPHRYGIVQVGNQYGIVTGTYQFRAMNCQIVSVQHVLGAFPINTPAGAIGGYNTTPAPPWRQAP